MTGSSPSTTTVTIASSKPPDKRKYVEIDTLRDERNGYPESLVLLCTSLYALMPLASLIILNLLLFLAFTRFWYVTLIYWAYVILDRKTCNTGGRRFQFIYKSKFWSYLAAYFPIKLRYPVGFKLNPNENYLLNYHPHGIAAFGCVAAFATNGLKFQKLFSGITTRFMVHETLFLVPLMRDICSARGDCSVNSKSIDYILSRGWKYGETGNLLALISGGLAEADLSDSRQLKIVVAKRKGFVKKALIHGANLIPCIAFGENSVFTRVDFDKSSVMHKIMTKWYEIFKFKHPIYYGTSISSQKLFGVLPYRQPITVVMGNPIEIERIEAPNQEQVDELHSRYLNELESLYEANSDLCAKFDRTLELI